jgi:hypothetical protein
MFCRCGIVEAVKGENPPRAKPHAEILLCVCITQILIAQRQRPLIRWRYLTAVMAGTRFLKPLLFQKDDQIADPV